MRKEKSLKLDKSNMFDYKIQFYSNDNSSRYILLRNKNKIIWCNYKILGTYDTNDFFWLSSKDMLVDKNVMYDLIKTGSTGQEELNDKLDSVRKKNVGIVGKRLNNYLFYFLIEQIIKIDTETNL